MYSVCVLCIRVLCCVFVWVHVSVVHVNVVSACVQVLCTWLVCECVCECVCACGCVQVCERMCVVCVCVCAHLHTHMHMCVCMCVCALFLLRDSASRMGAWTDWVLNTAINKYNHTWSLTWNCRACSLLRSTHTRTLPSVELVAIKPSGAMDSPVTWKVKHSQPPCNIFHCAISVLFAGDISHTNKVCRSHTKSSGFLVKNLPSFIYLFIYFFFTFLRGNVKYSTEKHAWASVLATKFVTAAQAACTASSQSETPALQETREDVLNLRCHTLPTAPTVLPSRPHVPTVAGNSRASPAPLPLLLCRENRLLTVSFRGCGSSQLRQRHGERGSVVNEAWSRAL